MTFQERCKDAAKIFLQTVVLIDDRLWQNVDQEKPGRLSKAPGFVRTESTPPRNTSRLAAFQAGLTDRSPDANSSIDARSLAESFASEGLVCGMIQPKSDSSIAGSTIRAVSRADVVILDWDLGETSERVGDMASQLLAAVFKNDTVGKVSRRRLFILYTGHANDAGKIREKISGKASGLKWEKENRYRTATGLHIVLWAKDGPAAPADVPKVSESDLPTKVIEEFTTINKGLLSNVVLSGLAAIRDNSHALLARFSPDLDLAFLVHRLFLPTPADSEQQAVALLSDELQTILTESKAASQVGLDACCELIEGLHPVTDLFGGARTFDLETWRTALENGLSNTKKNKAKIQQAISDLNVARGANEKFAALTAFRQAYSTAQHVLTLGSVIQRVVEEDTADASNAYLLCIQPPCDSVRLRQSRAFPFLPMAMVEAGKPFELVFTQESEGSVKLTIGKNSFECRMIEFEPTAGKDRVESSDHVFEAKDKTRYRWVADLKWPHAQKLVTEFASQVCRVGTDSSEWLHIMGR